MEYKIRHFSSVEIWEGDSPIYINLIIEPLEKSFKEWCKSESKDYSLITVIKEENLNDYKKEITNISIGDSNTLDFSGLDEYMVKGYNFQNNILCRLKKPFANIYRYCELFEKNRIVEECVDRLNFLYRNLQESNNQCELISILKTLDNWWY